MGSSRRATTPTTLMEHGARRLRQLVPAQQHLALPDPPPPHRHDSHSTLLFYRQRISGRPDFVNGLLTECFVRQNQQGQNFLVWQQERLLLNFVAPDAAELEPCIGADPARIGIFCSSPE